MIILLSLVYFVYLGHFCYGFYNHNHNHNHHNPYVVKYQRLKSVRHPVSSSSSGQKETINQSFKESLSKSAWVKFIAGASNQDLSSIRNLCLIYSLAGVDCIDVSADPAVVTAAREGIDKAFELISLGASSNTLLMPLLESVDVSRHSLPLLMISVNDDKDPHFRKAYFDPSICPSDCSRPCEIVCPAIAIKSTVGVINDRCYGCGRCVPVCPYNFITTENYDVSYEVINSLLSTGKIDAIEIHTQPNRVIAFSSLWSKIAESVIDHAKVVAVSFPDMQASTVDYLIQLNDVIAGKSLESTRAFSGYQIWQCDGRPMSGDISRGTAHKAAEFASRVFDGFEFDHSNNPSIRMGERHFIQLAGGTNDFSVVTAKENKLFDRVGFGGFAFGGYARKGINKILATLEEANKIVNIEDYDAEFQRCLQFATTLVNGVKKMSINSNT